MKENDEKKEYEMLKKLNKILADFSSKKQNDVNEKDDVEEER